MDRQHAIVVPVNYSLRGLHKVMYTSPCVRRLAKTTLKNGPTEYLPKACPRHRHSVA